MTIDSLGWNLRGYRITEELDRDAKTVVYRARQIAPQLGAESRSVVIKLLVSAYPTERELLNFRHQYTIAKNLDLPGVVRLESLEAYESGYALVMEDFGGVTLERYRQHHRLSPVDVLQIAIQLADTLHALGRERIVHKDIKPANILINPETREVKLIDFSIASRLPRETPELVSPSLVEGTLAYLAPEQTGRMNRGLDYRTDFYAVGVTLYELLTGKLPFEEADPLDLIYAHLARVAVSVDRVNPEVPVVVAEIVAKLMAKQAEDRYQSAWGIKYDLERCLHQWETTGTMVVFELAQRHVSDRFTIPERLYGREGAVKMLLDAFDRVAVGGSELVLVAGCSGIGKTAVIQEIHQPIARAHGYFIKGKFDQFNRNLPLSGFVRAFQDLITQLVSESAAQLAAWREKILAAVGANGQVLIAAIPELEQIIGSQPAVAELSGMAAQQRFSWVFQKFVEVFTTPEHPLTIFLDDLQWADAASLESIELLMAGRGYLLILGAYRDNEVSPSHPLMVTIDRLQQARTTVQMTLAPLTFDDLDRLVADTLRCERSRSQPLTELVALKTDGNPFFVTQFLKALHAAGEIWFNADGYWECDIVRIQALALSDDIVEFMAAQLQQLPPVTQHVLKLAACIGDRFDLETLAIVSERSPSSVATAIQQGLEAGLILVGTQIYQFWQAATAPAPLVPLPSWQGTEIAAGSGFRFLHDHVQQAAYSLIPACQQQQTHLQIGRLLLAHTPPAQQEARLFEIVNHFNTAIDLMQTPAERVLLAQLNLQATQRARAATAYAAAFSYAAIGTQLLTAAGWQQQYQLTLALHETAAEAALLMGDLESVPKLVEVVLERALTPLDRVKTYETIVQWHTLQKQYQQAIERGLEILHQLGIKLSPHPHQFIPLRSVVLTKIALWGKSNQQLLDLPESVAPKQLATLRILDILLLPAFFSSQELLVVLATVGVRLTLQQGNSALAASFYAAYGVVLSSMGDLQQSYRIGQLAMVLADRFTNLAIRAQVQVTVPWTAQPWQEHLRATMPIVDESLTLAIDSGNLTFVCVNAGMSIALRFYCGIHLDEIGTKIHELAALIAPSNDDSSKQFFALLQQTILNLQQLSSAPAQIVGDRESLLVAQWQATNEATLLSALYGFKTYLAYLFEDIPTALIYSDAQLPYEATGVGSYRIAPTWMFDALTRLAAYPQRDRQTQTQLLQRVNYTQRQLLKRARLMPANFQHKYDLVEAEKCRVLGNFTQAIDLYDRAIAGARTHEFIQEEAIANELAAKFYLGWGKAKIAAVYMQAAYYCYVLWGATAKTHDLERRYPELLVPILTAQQLELNDLDTLAKITTAAIYPPRQRTQSFDLATTIQAAQVLSSTIDLTELIRQLSEILLTNSGAQTCILVLPDGDADRWQVRSQSAIEPDGNSTTIQLSQPLVDGFEYPANLIYWTKNTRQASDFDARQPLEIPDLYLLKYQPASVFCLPIGTQERVLGIVYLEHRQTPAIFTDPNKTVISFLCTQAAIALDNANLYHQSQAAVADARRQQSYLAALLNNIPHRAWLKDRDSRFIAVNQPFGDCIGHQPSEFVGKSDLDYLPLALAQKHQADDLLVMTSGQRQIVEERIVNACGEQWLETIKTPIRDSHGEITGTVGIALDITDRKLMEVALRESEARYHQLISNVPGALYQFAVQADGTYSLNYISARCIELFELSPAAAMADIDRILGQIVPADRRSFERSIRRATRLGNAWAWEGQILTPSGQLKWMRGESRQTPIAATAGSIAWDGILMDITTRKQAEIALRQSETRYQKLADNIPGAIYQFRLAPDGSMSYPFISSGCWELFGLSPAAIVADADCLVRTIDPADVAIFHSSIAISAQNLTPKFWKGRAVLSTGELKWIECVSRPERQPDGSIVWDGVILDITAQQAALHERKQAEIALAASQQKNYNLIQSINGVVWEYDLIAKRFNFVSDRAVAILGYPISAWFQVNFWDLHLHPEDCDRTRAICKEAIANHRNCEVEYRLIAADGRIVWIYDTFTLIDDADGQPIATSGLFIDITERQAALHERKQVEIQLQQTNHRLELTNSELLRATRLKDDFLATMSHELRTPLNAILGMSEALQEEIFGTLTSRQLDSILTIEQSGAHLLSLIEDILDVSKISAGKLNLNISEVAVAELCRSSLILVRQQAIAKQIQIDTHLPAAIDRICVDERRMRQVLINLLNNAVKFTPNGGVVILSVRAVPLEIDRKAGYWLCFSVSDTGIGIAAADRSKLFQPFIQLDSSLNRKYAGTGLGLVLVKQIVELHGGNVTIDSEVGVGSCFTVTIPQEDLPWRSMVGINISQ
ncbi:AAA family ATPase [Chamaesiphon sp.]|uniref:AAA family ATPase n=1 Tax=Chamaesiphon sp. TaxID=2814140 RepID=UPI0035944FE4